MSAFDVEVRILGFPPALRSDRKAIQPKVMAKDLLVPVGALGGDHDCARLRGKLDRGKLTPSKNSRA
jgi:hypothetical protein